ncbi:hypothetical protein [Nonomuraea sediminis]|nr:hypothetical protein [Nonomuraea sediminis]
MRFSPGALFEVEATVSAWRQGDARLTLTMREILDGISRPTC